MPWVKRNGGAAVEVVFGRETHRSKPFEVTADELKALLQGQDSDAPRFESVAAPKAPKARKAGQRPIKGDDPDASVDGEATGAGGSEAAPEIPEQPAPSGAPEEGEK